jgi:hypothetical protein
MENKVVTTVIGGQPPADHLILVPREGLMSGRHGLSLLDMKLMAEMSVRFCGK